jgi:hypothetical protein
MITVMNHGFKNDWQFLGHMNNNQQFKKTLDRAES